MKIITRNRYLMKSINFICKAGEVDDLLCIDGGIYLYFCPSNIEYATPIDIVENKIFSIRRGRGSNSSALEIFLKNRGNLKVMPHLNSMEKKILFLFLYGKTKKLITQMLGMPYKRICSIKNRAIKTLGFRNENEFYVSIFNIKNVFKLNGMSMDIEYHYSM